MSRRIRLSAGLAALLLTAALVPAFAGPEHDHSGHDHAQADAKANPVVLMKTNQGDITIELYADKAPVTVKNFLTYVEEKFYDGTIFHRVIPGFMIQGGGFDQEMQKKATHEPIKNEASNGVRNAVGTIAMARTNVVDSATAQFFVNVSNNANLDHRSPDPRGFGYAVFGKVTSGMEVVRKIEEVKTVVRPPHRNLPEATVIIESVTRQ